MEDTGADVCFAVGGTLCPSLYRLPCLSSLLYNHHVISLMHQTTIQSCSARSREGLRRQVRTPGITYADCRMTPDPHRAFALYPDPDPDPDLTPALDRISGLLFAGDRPRRRGRQ